MVSLMAGKTDEMVGWMVVRMVDSMASMLVDRKVVDLAEKVVASSVV